MRSGNIYILFDRRQQRLPSLRRRPELDSLDLWYKGVILLAEM
jgi:hypothetical protein